MTALAALAARDAGTPTKIVTNDHLLIFGLAVSEAQQNEFREFVERMALSIHPFASVSNLSDPQVDDLWKLHVEKGEVRQAFEFLTGLPEIDEVYVVRDWQLCNRLALSLYPQSLHICYGDSVGVYFPRPGNKLNDILQRTRRNFLDKMGFATTADSAFRIDISYLLLPEAFATPPSKSIIPTNRSDFIRIYQKAIPLISNEWLRDIKRKVMGEHIWIFMGSNFSEQGLMTVEQEIAAYREWILSLVPVPATIKLLIKSHPRDSNSKYELLADAMRTSFAEVISLNDAAGSYAPVEMVLLELRNIAKSIECLAVSTACLGCGLVLGLPTRVGFGKQLVSKYFPRRYRASRVRHEARLNELCFSLTRSNR